MFTKITTVLALTVASSNATGFTMEQARGLHGMKRNKTPFTAADLPKSKAIFDMFDKNGDGKIVPAEVYAVHESNWDKTKGKENRKAFMKAMDANLRKFCGVAPRPVKVETSASATQTQVVKRTKKDTKGEGKRGKRSERMRKWRKNMKKKMKNFGKKMETVFENKNMKKSFAKMAMADKNGDYEVDAMEMGESLHKWEYKMCKKYKK